MKKEDIPDKGRTFPVDPNLPRCVCQNCHHALCIVGVDSYVEKFPNDSSRSAMQGSLIPGASSVLGSTRMDNSFVLLPKQKPLAQGIPPGPRGVPGQSDAAQPGKTMEESFVVVYKSESASDGGGTQLPLSEGGPNSPLQPNNSGFHSTITVLKRAFEIATTQTQVEQPLCLECMRVLSDKLDKEIEDASRDIEAYEACLQRLEGEPRDVLSEADFCKEKLKEERDAILAKTEVSQAHLELLKRTNVLNDAFPIWHDGEFGTINNFRLGRLPKIPVEWDEINAAWGQACLLLHTMCQYFRPKFLYRIKIIPMGSYPRIMDSNNNTYDLFGPVNLFWSTRYDKAMTLFLTCLKDFAEFANSKDQENNIPPEKRFNLPYKIENDKVENYSITQSFNKQENWTKALKYTLCNLKWALYWFIGSTNFQPLSAMVSSATEVPAVGSLYAKRGPDPKILARKPSNS
ncbi:beclin-1-like protein isoform X3 [Durio zibethinus]|uniref:Beclin-1-like protein isoform X3 n=1 Tax=Durio zibethinus TaxID=66656 RepID=A0A6P6B0A7_DURZI|nr:beclin-1-like protein isoform X3 [Durio zibethinus]